MTTIDIPMSADTMLASGAATTNYDTLILFAVGEDNTVINIYRSWIKPDFSSIPTGVKFNSVTLKLTPALDRSSTGVTAEAHRCLRAVVSNQATWNVYSTGNIWGTSGCSNSTTDYDGAVTLGTWPQSATPTLNVPQSITLTASEIQKLFDGTYVNNGIILFVPSALNDAIGYASIENTTSAYRPIMTIDYTIPSNGNFFLMF